MLSMNINQQETIKSKTMIKLYIPNNPTVNNKNNNRRINYSNQSDSTSDLFSLYFSEYFVDVYYKIFPYT